MYKYVPTLCVQFFCFIYNYVIVIEYVLFTYCYITFCKIGSTTRSIVTYNSYYIAIIHMLDSRTKMLTILCQIVFREFPKEFEKCRKNFQEFQEILFIEGNFCDTIWSSCCHSLCSRNKMCKGRNYGGSWQYEENFR